MTKSFNICWRLLQKNWQEVQQAPCLIRKRPDTWQLHDKHKHWRSESPCPIYTKEFQVSVSLLIYMRLESIKPSQLLWTKSSGKSKSMLMALSEVQKYSGKREWAKFQSKKRKKRERVPMCQFKKTNTRKVSIHYPRILNLALWMMMLSCCQLK